MQKATEPELLDFRDDAVLVRFARVAMPEVSGAVQAFYTAVLQAKFSWLIEAAPALASVLVRFDPSHVSRDAVREALRVLVPAGTHPTPPAAKRLWTVPACFAAEFAPDLDAVAAHLKCSPEQAVTQLCAQELRVLAIGFAPGQPYLGLLPEEWDMPRQTALTPRVPAGAIVTAVRQIVLFANDSPTGWRQVGRSAFRPFQPQQSEPFPLSPTDALTFQPVFAEDFRALLASNDPMGGATCQERS